MDMSTDFWQGDVEILAKNDGQYSILYDTKRA
jgi:hypothetical protein